MGAHAEILPPVRFPPPMPSPVILTETGHVVLPLGLGSAALSRLGAGLLLDWSPAPELGGTIFSFAAGGAERTTTLLNRATLRRTIEALQSIEQQLEDLG